MNTRCRLLLSSVLSCVVLTGQAVPVAAAEADGLAALHAWCQANACGLVSRLPPAELAAVLAALPPVAEALPAADPRLPLRIAVADAAYDLGWSGRVLVVEPALDEFLLPYLMARVPPDVAPVLGRQEDGGYGAEPEVLDRLIAAAGTLYHRDRGDEAQATLRWVANWMAAPWLDRLARKYDRLRDGVMLVELADLVPGLDADLGPHILLVVFPLTTLDHPLVPVRHAMPPLQTWVYGPRRNRFEQLVHDAGLLISDAELAQRLRDQAEIAQPGPLAGARWLQPVSGAWTAETWREALEAWAKASEQALLWPGDELPDDLNVVAAEQPRRHLAEASLRVSGLLALDPDAPAIPDDTEPPPGTVAEPSAALEITGAQTLEDTLRLAQPLPLWTHGRLSRPARWWAEVQLRRHVWAVLGELDAPRAGGERLWLKDVDPRLADALRPYLAHQTGTQYDDWLQNLPARDGTVPLWLYYSKAQREYELAAPSGSELLSGAAARRVDMVISGDEVISADWHPEPVIEPVPEPEDEE